VALVFRSKGKSSTPHKVALVQGGCNPKLHLQRLGGISLEFGCFFKAVLSENV